MGLSNNEKAIIETFQQRRIPTVYKMDTTDNILFVEHVDFDLCNMLLRNKRVNEEYLQKEIKEYAIFLSQISISNYSDYDKSYLNLLMDVVNIFLKHNL